MDILQAQSTAYGTLRAWGDGETKPAPETLWLKKRKSATDKCVGPG